MQNSVDKISPSQISNPTEIMLTLNTSLKSKANANLMNQTLSLAKADSPSGRHSGGIPGVSLYMQTRRQPFLP